MIMQTEKSNVQSNIDNAREFVIEATSNIMETLSTRLYTNPIRAIIRETVSNAIDANIDKGIDEPIKLHLPTRIEPEFYVEDHGIGMDEETIYNVYTHYGNSTKSGSNKNIGGLGLGSKTPFAYTTQFFVISAKDGIRNTYICFKNEEGLPSITKTNSETVPADVTGTKVSFPVKTYDISDFVDEAIITLLFTLQMPEIVGNLEEFLMRADCDKVEDFVQYRDIIKNNTYIDNDQIRRYLGRSSYGSLIVEMGGVAYKVDQSELMDGEGTCDSVLSYVRNKAETLVLHLPIGAVNIQSSREALHYSQRTKDRLTQEIVKLFLKDALAVTSDGETAQIAA